MIRRSVLRMIRKSIGRYLAIFAIIALGVGFFSGLRVTERAMIRTADQYLQELSFFDFRLVSTLGFTKEDVRAFSKIEGVGSAAGSVSTDFLCTSENGSDQVLHAHMLLDSVNRLSIQSGRLPETAEECVLDCRFAEQTHLGDKITLSAANSEDTLAHFTYREYTVVGFANASYYINFERGTSSLGSGSVAGFVYLLPDGFTDEIFTEIFLTLPYHYEMNSTDYEEAIDTIQPRIQALLEERAKIRYEKLRNDAEKQITEAQTKLDQKTADAQKAQQEVDDAWESLRTHREAAEASLTEAKNQLDAMRKTLDQKRTDLENALASPSASLPGIKEQLEQAQKEWQAGEARYEAQLANYETQCQETQARFAETEKKLTDLQSQIDAALPALEQARQEISQARSELDNLRPASTYLLDRNTNVGYASLKNDTAIVSGVSKVFPLFFFLVSALVCITTMTRMVSEHRTENGVLKALGFESGTIISQYLVYAGSASALGCIVGFLIGSRFLPMALWQVYQIMYSIRKPVVFVLDWALFALCTALFLICALGATWLVCARELREVPAELIRPKAPSAGKRILLERIPILWSHVPFLHKVSIRNILRYKRRMFMMILGIGGCTALLLTGFGIRDTIRPIVDHQYDEISLYDASVSFREPMDDQGKKNFLETKQSVIEEAAFLHTQSVDLDDQSGSINLIVFDLPLHRFIDLHQGKNTLSWPTQGEAAVNYRFAQEHDLHTGDTIVLSCGDQRKLTLTVSAIYDQYIYDYIYVSADTCLSQWGEAPQCNSAYLLFPQDTDSHAAAAALLGTEEVASVSVSDDMRTRVGNMLESLNYIVLIVLVCAGALAFIVLYNLTNITITERIREIATLKVLGFYAKESDSYVFRENLILTGISTICGIPMGIALLRYVMAQIKISALYFGCRLAPLSYLWAILLTFVFALAVDFALTFKMKRINMAEALKTIE